MKIILILTLSVFLVSCASQQPAANQQQSGTPYEREQFANTLGKIVKVGGGESTFFETREAEKTTLLIRSGSITEKDCLDFIRSDYGPRAKSIGFNKVVCMNDTKINQWTFDL